MDKLWFIHAMKSYPQVKMNEQDPYLSMWIHLKCIIMGEEAGCQRMSTIGCIYAVLKKYSLHVYLMKYIKVQEHMENKTH